MNFVVRQANWQKVGGARRGICVHGPRTSRGESRQSVLHSPDRIGSDGCGPDDAVWIARSHLRPSIGAGFRHRKDDHTARQLLAGQGGAKIGIAYPHQSQRSLTHRRGLGVARSLSPIAGHQLRGLAIAAHQTFDQPNVRSSCCVASR